MMMRLWMSLLLAVLLQTSLAAQVGSENRKFMEGRKHILFLGGSKYYAHDAVSKAMYTLAKLGEESGLFDVMFRTDYRLVTKSAENEIPYYRNAKNLNYFDAIMIYTQGELELTPDQKADLLSFVRDDGKGILAAHSGTDFNRWHFTDSHTMVIQDKGDWPEFIDLIGGVFISHPWRQKVRINVEDRTFPATKHLPKSFEIEDEIYQMGDLSRDKVRVLMTLDVSTVDMKNPPLAPVVRTDNDFALAWAHNYGKGRVFVSPLGHILGSWDRPEMQTMWLEAAKWVLKLTDAEASPLPRPAAK